MVFLGRLVSFIAQSAKEIVRATFVKTKDPTKEQHKDYKFQLLKINSKENNNSGRGLQRRVGTSRRGATR